MAAPICSSRSSVAIGAACPLGVGVGSLPGNITVEIEAIVEIAT